MQSKTMQAKQPPDTSGPPRLYDRFVKLGLLFCLLFFGGFIAWALLAKLDEGVIAEGSITVESRTKTIQHLEGGIIDTVFVIEGQTVRAGDVLIRMDTTQAAAQKDQVATQLLTTWVRLDRLNAERLGAATIAFRPALRGDNPQIVQIRDVQKNLFDARRRQAQGQSDILRQRIVQLEDQVDGLAAQRHSAEAQITLIQEEIDRYSQLEQLQATDVRQRLQRERELAQLKGQLGKIDADIARTRVSMGETQIEILQVERGFQENVADELTQAQDRALSLAEQLYALEDILARTDIVAPAAGAVLNLKFATVGGVIPPGQPIMEIVPLGDQLEIQARVAANDVDNVDIGQSVRITIAGLNQRTTPELEGMVVSVAADAVADELTGQPFYPVRIAFHVDELDKLGEQSLRPGMIVQVFIRGGQRTPMDYFVQPITDTLKRALRES